MDISADKLFEKLDTHQMPSVDRVLIQIVDACNREDVTFDQLADIISTDSSLTVKVLTIVNSPVYSPVQPFVTVRSAVVVLGTETIKTLAITASLRQVLDSYKVAAVFDKKSYWKKALYCGLMVKELAGLTGYNRSDEAYLAGLLHNIGELVIASNFPSELQYYPPNDAEGQLAFERKQFGFNRYEVGAWVVSQWRLHPFISDAILFQQESRESIKNSHILVRFIYLARQLNSSEQIPDETRFEVAEQMFGLSAGMIRQLMKKVDDDVAQIAKSMSIKLPESAFRDKSQRCEPPIPSGGIVSAGYDADSCDLLNRVRERALADSVRPLIENATNRWELIERLQICVFVLFGTQRTLLFVPDPQKRTLIGYLEQDADNQNSQIDVLLRDEHSVIANAFRTKTAAMSILNSRSAFTSIVDRQVAKLFSSDGLYCVPVSESGIVAGVMTLGIPETRASQYEKNLTLLEELGAIVAKTLNRTAEQHKKSDQSELNDRLNERKVRGLVHEAANPLTVLRSYIVVLAKKLEGNYQEELKIISGEIDRVGRIIRQIDDISYVNKEEDIDINELINELLSIFLASYFISPKVALSFIPDRKAPRIKIKSDVIKQIMTNLIKNAVEAINESGAIKIVTKSNILIGNKRYIEIIVSDSGPGIPPDISEKLFKHPLSTKGSTRGYGLFMVKKLLQEIGGLIKFKSKEKQGSIFHILIPVRKSN